MFYILSLVSGVLECGWLFFGMSQMPVWLALTYPLSYHLGNLFPLPFSLKKTKLKIMCCCVIVIVYTLLFLLMFGCSYSDPPLWISIFALSAVIQSLRSDMKTGGNTLFKRVMRVCGFALAPAAVHFSKEILLIAAVLSLEALYRSKPKERPAFTPMKSCGGFCAVMIFHQLHYFVYAHIMLFCAGTRLGMTAAAILFCMTWVTYMVTEPILKKIGVPAKTAFFAGHIGLTLLLAAMSFASPTKFIWPLWVVTGFFGGTVYTISELACKKGVYDKTSMTIAENYGHIGGLVLALVMSCVSSALRGVVHIPEILRLSSLCAFFAVITMAAVLRGEEKYENTGNDLVESIKCV